MLHTQLNRNHLGQFSGKDLIYIDISKYDLNVNLIKHQKHYSTISWELFYVNFARECLFFIEKTVPS